MLHAIVLAMALKADPLPNPHPTGCFATISADWNRESQHRDFVSFAKQFHECAGAEKDEIQKRSALVGEYGSDVMLVVLAMSNKQYSDVEPRYNAAVDVLFKMGELAQRFNDRELLEWAVNKSNALARLMMYPPADKPGTIPHAPPHSGSAPIPV
jgi:hypothetical protein